MNAEVRTSERQSSTLADLPGIARVLVNAGQLTLESAQALVRATRESGSSFIAGALAAGVLAPAELAHSLSATLALPLIDLDSLDATRLPANVIDAKFAADSQFVVLGRRGNRVFIGSADPTDNAIAERIKFTTQLTAEWVVVEHDKVVRLLESRKAGVAERLDSLAGDEIDFDVEDLQLQGGEPEAAPSEVEDTPVVRFLQKMLVDAINMRASDLHFEPYEQSYRVRFRIDGELREMAQPPLAIKDKLASRIKVVSRLDISEKRVPQDGRMKLKFGGKSIDFRISTLPTLFGEKIVIRILDSSSAKMGIDALGYEPAERQRLLQAIGRPYGMILVTGPTGSGKTVSLYTCLNMLNKPGVNISTVEDPAEINLPGINQVNVNDKAGLSFSAALKSFLRQDPDIIMVGEIRDLETADIAIKAAQTGHLVMSTLHTNDAPTTLTRLLNMGVAPFNIASSVLLITAQRLARRLCEKCKTLASYPPEALRDAGFEAQDVDGGWQPYRAVGCAACNNGYKGRVGIYQVMPISDEIQRIILSQGSALDIADQARREGVRDLRQSALIKVRAGVTSLEEVLSVTNE